MKSSHEQRKLRAPLLAAVPLACAFLTAADAETNYEAVKWCDGIWGVATLIEGSDGRLYGTAEGGGAKGEGLVFKVNKDGSEYTVLHSFTALRGGGDGSKPQGLLEGSDGALYGTAQEGGCGGGVMELFGLSAIGNGAVFKLNKDGSGYTVVRRFTGSDGDGSQPWAGLVEGRDGALYGTTLQSGTGTNQPGFGTVFKLRKDGSGYRVLHHFKGAAGDGSTPFAGLMVGANGVLWGTTDGGGTADARNGTVFKLNPDGGGYRVAHSFPNDPGDGRMPRKRLLEGIDGTIYGTTQNGGTNDAGIIFKQARDGNGYMVVHRFSGSSGGYVDPKGMVKGILNGVPVKMSFDGDGADPQCLVLGRDGTLYGTTKTGGSNGGGTVFKLNPDGSGFAVLHHFPSFVGDGSEPSGALVTASEGALYGMTERNSTNNSPLLFKVSIPVSRQTPVSTSR